MEEKLKQKPANIIKVVLFGPESTGKTTLAKELANHYKTEWVPEYAREYLQEKWNKEQKTCEPMDLITIAVCLIRLEYYFSVLAYNLIICDTDFLVTNVFSEAYYMGFCYPVLEIYSLNNNLYLYVLSSIYFPWV